MTNTFSFTLFGKTTTKQYDECRSLAVRYGIHTALVQACAALRPDDAMYVMGTNGFTSAEGQAEAHALVKRCEKYGVSVEFLVEFDDPEDFDTPALRFAPSVEEAVALMREHASHDARFEGVRLFREEAGMNRDSLNVSLSKEGVTYSLWMQRGGNYIVSTAYEKWGRFVEAVQLDYMGAMIDGLV